MEMNRENDKLVATEDVSLDQRNTSDVELGKTENNSEKIENGKFIKGILLFCVLLIVAAITVRLVLVEKINEDKNELQLEENCLDGVAVPFDIQTETLQNGRSYVVLKAVDYASDGDSFKYLRTGSNMQNMRNALKNKLGLVENSEKLVALAFDENKGIAYRLFAPDFVDSITFYYEQEEVELIYRKVLEEDGCIYSNLLQENNGYGRFNVGNYSIPIPETMYLSNDTSFGIQYNFKQKDPSKYARIQVKTDYDDYVEIVEMLRKGERFQYEEEVFIREYLMEELATTGMNPKNFKGPHYGEFYKLNH